MGFPDTFVEDTPRGLIPPLVHMPSLTALTTLSIEFCMVDPSPRLTNILCHISPTPTLTSIIIGHNIWSDIKYCLQSRWADVDEWLARMTRHGGLSVTLIRWPRGKSVWKGFLREFRKAGGEVKTDSTATADDYIGLDDDNGSDDNGHQNDYGFWDNDIRDS